MIRAHVFLKAGGEESFLEEMTFAERPFVGMEIAGKYVILSISSPVPIGNNASSSEPEMGIKVSVKDMRAL
jgi:hypothetical protein